jgi:hypothetical protein
MPTIEYTEVLTTTRCWCGIALAAPSNLVKKAQTDGKTSLYCPLGHSFGWYESEADKLRKRLAQAEGDKKWYAERMQAERDLRSDTERRLSAQKAATTRARKRAAAALCPCCNRSFVQLRRHMAAKHPNFDPA